MITEKQKKIFEESKELDFSFGLREEARFRVNVYVERGSIAVALRRLPTIIPSFGKLGLPPIVSEMAAYPRGLVLVTGPTGSGKTTTLAAMIDKINRERAAHIITIEDPIEYVHNHKKCLVNQREVQSDTVSFKGALRYILRQDPDVVLIGEMRDLETMEAALTVSETGHLVLGTLHTNSCVQTINRIVDVFPAHQQVQVRVQLSLSLEGVLSQMLLPKIGGGRVMAMEVMVCTPAIRALIRDDKVHQMYSLIQVGSRYGMKTMNQSLCEVVEKGLVSTYEAMMRSPDPKELDEMMQKRTLAQSTSRRG
jgi:twitching motility protein PilT